MKPDIDQHIIYDLNNNESQTDIDELFLTKKVDIIAEFEGENNYYLLKIKNLIRN
jgi:hypothetical protein